MWSVVLRAVARVALFCARCRLFSFLCAPHPRWTQAPLPGPNPLPMCATNDDLWDCPTGSLAPAASKWSPGAATSTEDRNPGGAPRREGLCCTRASFQVGGCAESSWGRRRDSSKPSRGVVESAPASCASSITRQGDAVREFPGTGQEEGGRGQRVGFASPERVDTTERRGCRRGATVGDCRRRRKMAVPKSRPISRPVVSFTCQVADCGRRAFPFGAVLHQTLLTGWSMTSATHPRDVRNI